MGVFFVSQDFHGMNLESPTVTCSEARSLQSLLGLSSDFFYISSKFLKTLWCKEVLVQELCDAKG